jgi:hypothetical protein
VLRRLLRQVPNLHFDFPPDAVRGERPKRRCKDEPVQHHQRQGPGMLTEIIPSQVWLEELYAQLDTHEPSDTK